MNYFYILAGLTLARFTAWGMSFKWEWIVYFCLPLAVVFDGFLLYTLYQFMNGVEGGFESMATVINLIIQHIQSKGI